MKKFNIFSRCWNSNVFQWQPTEQADTIEEAISISDAMATCQCRNIGDNCFVNDGVESWVEDDLDSRSFTGARYMRDEILFNPNKFISLTKIR